MATITRSRSSSVMACATTSASPDSWPCSTSRVAGGWRLDGVAPWLTGAEAAAHVVVGAAVVDGAGEPTGEEVLVAAPTRLEGAILYADFLFCIDICYIFFRIR